MSACPACLSEVRCDGCRVIEGRYEVVGRLSEAQEAALATFLAASGKTPAQRRRAYLGLEDVGLPLCNASPRFGDEPMEEGL
jgi:hypothetical protein